MCEKSSWKVVFALSRGHLIKLYLYYSMYKNLYYCVLLYLQKHWLTWICFSSSEKHKLPLFCKRLIDVLVSLWTWASLAWWHTPWVAAVWRQRQEDLWGLRLVWSTERVPGWPGLHAVSNQSVNGCYGGALCMLCSGHHWPIVETLVSFGFLLSGATVQLIFSFTLAPTVLWEGTQSCACVLGIFGG